MTKEIANLILSTDYGFLTKEDLKNLIKIDAGFPVVVKFGCSPRRFVMAKHVNFTIEEAEKRGDYVRDIFFSCEQLDEAKRTLDRNS